MRLSVARNDSEIVDRLRHGQIGVVRTDTLYGLVALARDEQAVERLFQVKARSANKSPIVLIASQSQLFDEATPEQSTFFASVWPGAVSVIVPARAAPAWITRGNASVAYRLPDDPELVDLIKQTGPLVAPSANPQGAEPATTIQQAIEYFGETVDFYVDSGAVVGGVASRLMRQRADGTWEQLR